MEIVLIACTLNDDPLSARKNGLLAEIVALSTKQTKLPTGYRLEFPATSDALTRIVGMIDAERQCCRFLRFTLIVERRKPLNGNGLCRKAALEGAPPFQTARKPLILKRRDVGVVIEHAWKAKRASGTKKFRSTTTHTRPALNLPERSLGVRPQTSMFSEV